MTVAATGVPAGHAMLKFAIDRVAGAMGLLKVAVIGPYADTPATGGVLATGDVAMMVGATLKPGVPRIGSRPPPSQPARKAAKSATSGAILNLRRTMN